MAHTFSSKSPHCLSTDKPRSFTITVNALQSDRCTHTCINSRSPGKHANNSHNLSPIPKASKKKKKNRRASCLCPSLRHKGERERESARARTHTHTHPWLCYLFMSVLRMGSLSVSKHSPWAFFFSFFLDSEASS